MPAYPGPSSPMRALREEEGWHLAASPSADESRRPWSILLRGSQPGRQGR